MFIVPGEIMRNEVLYQLTNQIPCWMRFSLFLRSIGASASSSATTENTSNNEATAAKGNSHVNKCTNTHICAMLTSDRNSTRIFLEILNPSLIAYELLLIGISKFSVDQCYFKLPQFQAKT